MRYYPRRVDRNQKDIASALTAAGCTVQLLHMVGGGCPDLLVGVHGFTWLLEVKAEKAQTEFSEGVRGTNAATAAKQKAWALAWRGAPPIMVRSPEEALGELGLLKEKPAPTGVERFGGG